jgi:hypothetical protein
MRGALCDERMGLSYTVVIVSGTYILYLDIYMSAFYIVSQLLRVRFLMDTHYLQFYI